MLDRIRNSTGKTPVKQDFFRWIRKPPIAMFSIAGIALS